MTKNEIIFTESYIIKITEFREWILDQLNS